MKTYKAPLNLFLLLLVLIIFGCQEENTDYKVHDYDTEFDDAIREAFSGINYDLDYITYNIPNNWFDFPVLNDQYIMFPDFLVDYYQNEEDMVSVCKSKDIGLLLVINKGIDIRLEPEFKPGNFLCDYAIENEIE